MNKQIILKGRQLATTTIAKRFKMFWDIRKPSWKGTDEELIDDIFDDPDFQEPFRIFYPQGYLPKLESVLPKNKTNKDFSTHSYDTTYAMMEGYNQAIADCAKALMECQEPKE